MHMCPRAEGPTPHIGGPIVEGDSSVMIDCMPAARAGDAAVCVGAADAIAMGSGTVRIGGRPAARAGDLTQHGGFVVMGCPTVMIGDVDDDQDNDVPESAIV